MELNLRDIIEYDEKSGIFYNKKTKKLTGTLADDGYVYIWVKKNKYRADKLALRFATGKWYHCPIIHKNGVNSDNWLSNLEPRPVKKSNGKPKVTGIHWCRRSKRWIVLIFTDKKQKYIGRSENFDTAVLIRYKAEILYGYNLEKSTAHQYIKKMFL